MNNYGYDRTGCDVNRIETEFKPKLKGGKGDPNELRVKMNSKDKPKWMKR